MNKPLGTIEQQIFADRMERTKGDKSRLEWSGYKVHSQSDEDGIIDEIFRRIGTTTRTFVEFGAETGNENNSRLLLERGWRGLWIEGYQEYLGSIKWQFRQQIASGQLTIQESYVDRDNINALIGGAGITGEIDFLSIDIDGNDYHVFDAITVIHPRVVCLEFNISRCGDYVMPYNPDYRWDASKDDYGASAVALTRLATDKGYELVGCGLYSPNGFYVRRDLIAGQFRPRSPDEYVNPFSYEKIVSFPVREDLKTFSASGGSQ